MWRSSVSSAAWMWVAALSGCSLVAPGDEILSSGRCSSDEKLCGDSCSLTSNPAVGCGRETCEPCAAAHAAAICAEAECAIGACELGFADCNDSAADGCETDLRTDAAHCGSCAKACNTPHAVSGCKAGSCVVTGCAKGYGECDGESETVCETDLTSSPTSCGSCGTPCSLPWVTQAACVSAQCAVAQCQPSRADCDQVSANGCETDTTTNAAHCGGCAISCTDQQLCDLGKCVARCPAIRALHGQARLSVAPKGFGVGSGDFTIEVWLSVSSDQPGALFGMNEEYAVSGVTLATDGTRVLCSVLDPSGIGPNTGSAFIEGPKLVPSVWTHLACVRTGSTLTLFEGGKAVNSGPVGTTLAELSPFAIGVGGGYSGTPGSATAPMTLGPFRFSKVARYTAAFTPTASWSIDASTVAQFLTAQPFAPVSTSVLVDEAGGDNVVTSFGGFEAALAGVPCGGD